MTVVLVCVLFGLIVLITAGGLFIISKSEKIHTFMPFTPLVDTRDFVFVVSKRGKLRRK